MDKRFLAILAAMILLFAGVFWATKSKTNAPGNSVNGKPSNHLIGTNTTGVTFTEYGDYQCPYCGEYYPIIKQVQQKYSSQVAFQFRNFPLIQLHPNAMAAARAAEAASLQGKFWEMHDLLYENQNSWASSSNAPSLFGQYANQIGLNASQFQKDEDSAAVLGTINADTAAGQALGINATPTFFINGKKIDKSPTDVAGFAKLIDAAIAANKKH